MPPPRENVNMAAFAPCKKYSSCKGILVKLGACMLQCNLATRLNVFDLQKIKKALGKASMKKVYTNSLTDHIFW